MQIKAASDLKADIDAGEALLIGSSLSAGQRRTLNVELRRLRGGLAGEQEAAYHLEVFFGRSKNFMTIHDLRFEVDGYSVQIDHLVLNRLSEIWVCESKHFVEGATINDHGEWSRSWAGKAEGMESPIAQNRRHIHLLRRAFDDGLVPKPKRLGVAPMTPTLRSLVLVSKDAIIKRPRRRLPELDEVIKVEQIDKHIRDAIDAAPMIRIASFASSASIEVVAHNLARLHKPKRIQWEQRLGLVPNPNMPASALVAPTRSSRGERQVVERACEECTGPISAKEVWYSASLMKRRFGGRALCRACQSLVPPTTG